MTHSYSIREGRTPASETVVYAAEIHNLLACFFEALDDKNWAVVQKCLCDEVFADYSSFCDLPARTMPAAQYIEERQEALDWLDTQHSFQNLRVAVDPIEGTASARCNYAIRRFDPGPGGSHYFHSYGHYYFDFVSLHGEWKISRIKQHLLCNEGDRDVHSRVWCA